MRELKTYTPGQYDASVRKMHRRKSANICAFLKDGANVFLTPDVLDSIKLPLIPIISNNKFGFIDVMCNIVVEPIYDEIKGTFRSTESIISVRKSNKWTVLNASGEELLPLTYGTIIPGYDCPLATIQNQSNSKVVNVLTKDIIVNNRFDYIGGFRYGFARVRIGDNNTGKWGIINEFGGLVVPTQYFAVYSFYDFPKSTTVLKLFKDSQERFVSLDNLETITEQNKDLFEVQTICTDTKL